MDPVRKRVDRRVARLKASSHTFSDLFELIFGEEELVYAEMSSPSRRLSFSCGEVKRDVETLARAIARLGVRGRYIGLYGQNSLRWIVAFWGVLKSGNTPYLVNLRQPVGFSDGIMQGLDCPFVLDCDGNCGSSLPLRDYAGLMESAGEPVAELPEFGNGFAISTNGTTLREKVCFYDGERITAQLLNITKMLETGPDLVRPCQGGFKALAFLPFYHIFGLEATYLWYSLFGATFVFVSDMNPDTILRTVRKHRVTHIFAVPLLWHGIEKSVLRSLESRDEKTRKKFEKACGATLWLWDRSPALGRLAAKKLFADVRKKLFGDSVVFCISGGSYIKPSALRLINAIGYPLYNGYGSTEVGITSVELSPKASDRLLGSIGKPFESVSYTAGPDGRLLIRGTSLCASMTVDGQHTETGGFFDTGDLVRLDGDGRAYIDGRISDLVFSDDGENLNPDLAEQGFALSGAKSWCVTGNADNTKLCLVVQTEPDITPEELSSLREEIAAQNSALPVSYQVKEIVITADGISDPGSIKVSRAALRRKMEGGQIRPLAGAETVREEKQSQSEIGKELRAIFADLLGISEEEITDNGHFMNDLGGSSLDYFTLLGEISRRFGVSVELESDSFGYTLSDLERIIAEQVS